MSRFLYSENEPSQPVYIPVFVRQPKKYGFFRFIFDIAMVTLTSGLWLIWIFVREMRKR